ncbi:Hypothetical predicted protein [Olea europaea subsp. europaea]|uniref:Uncharacterized protein n=1 Tax=Olea europaea subsp. europaea TaxID=158383 RepID=A0A8S0UJE8_OLEEU|nr:Hypothetical predicted protein [Olea europaea subsp. europaea]
METNLEENQNSVQDFTDMSHDFYSKMKLSSYSDEDDEEDEEEEFSFTCGVNISPIAAEDAFINGQIKPLFPLFNQDTKILYEDLPVRPAVNKVFVERRDGMTSSSSENDDFKVVEEVFSPEVCTKSNSTGFSKTWRFKDSMGRSNSDGRDAFVFLRDSNTPPPSMAKMDTATATAKVNGKVKNSKKNKTAPLSAHEMYLKSKAKEEGRRKSYLPYRTGLMGFFTNLNGGLTRNVNPF